MINAGFCDADPVTSPGEPHAYIISQDDDGTRTARIADITGPVALTDPRLQEQLHAVTGQQLSEYSISRFSLHLSFRGEDATTPSRTISIEQDTIEITQPGQQRQQVPARSELTATTLLNTLDHRLNRIQISNGHLRLAFDNSVQLDVAPDQQWEAWQMNSEDGLTMVCGPGGELTIWYPRPSH
jgi:Family of unknown function (DUF6188)